MGEGKDVKVVYTYGDWWTKMQLVLRYGPSCYYCAHVFSDTVEGWCFMTIDELTPRKLGGTRDDFANLRLACKSCNSAKGGKVFGDRSPELAEFRDGVKRSMETYEPAIRERMEKLRLLREQEGPHAALPTPAELGAALIKCMAESKFARARPKRGRTDRLWFTRSAGGKEFRWGVAVDNCQLQAAFVSTASSGNRQTEEQRLLEKQGFMYDPKLRYFPYKQVPPFIQPEDGMESIRKEVLEFEASLLGLPAGGNAREHC